MSEGNNQNFARGSPTELSFFSFFGQSGISSTNWREQPEFCKGFPHWDIFFLVQKDKVSNRQAGVWIDFYFSDFLNFARVFLPNPLSIIIIVEYSMISVL